jgi:uncharacterized protein (TIGR03437 family)
MIKKSLLLALAVSAVAGGGAGAQTVPNPVPARVLGQLYPNATLEDFVQFRGVAPNGVEGREFNNPMGVAVDPSGPEPIVYVADTENNRVLGWRRSAGLQNGQRADIVIGQRDFYSTGALGGLPLLPQGLSSPAAAAVDRHGNLFVYDVGNNRILRYPKPLEQTAEVKAADLVIGQVALTTRNAQNEIIAAAAPNQGRTAPDRTTLRTAFRVGANVTTQFAALAFDGEGNLWAADPGNHRVLRYPAARVSGPSNTAPGGAPVEADLVLGQAEFDTAAANPGTFSTPTVAFNNRMNRERLRFPMAVAVDQSGNLFVSDDLSRVLAYRGPLFSGKPADRVMGLLTQAAPVVNDTSFGIEVSGTVMAGGPRGLFTLGDTLYVIDSSQNRILRFEPLANWPAESPQGVSPRAIGVIGQADFFNGRPNREWMEPWKQTLSFPTAAAVAGPELFVADSRNNRVLALPLPAEAGPATEAALVLGQISFEYRAPNLAEGREFAQDSLAGVPVGVATALDLSGDTPHFYVADPGNNRVLAYRDARRIQEGGWADFVIGQVDFGRILVNSPTGDGRQATESGLFMPSAVAVDSEGNLWVADTGNGRVVRYPRPFDNPGGPHVPDIVVGKPNANSRSETAASETNLLFPVSIAFTPDGHLVVADAGHNRVLVFVKEFSSGMGASLVLGQPDYASSAPSSDAARFSFPISVATDSSGRIYVADFGNAQLKIFAEIWKLASGTPPTLTMSAARGAQFLPISVAVSSRTGIVYVVDAAQSRIVTLPDYDRILVTEIANTAPRIALVNAVGRNLTLDAQDNLVLTDGASRVTFHYPRHVVVSFGNSVDKVAPHGLGHLVAPGVRFSEEAVGEPNSPLPRALNGIEVLVNGVPAPLRRLNNDTIQLQIPASTPSNTVVQFLVRHTETWQILAHDWIRVDRSAPAFIAINPPGAGQVRALNPDGTENSTSRPVERNQEITLFLTGQGFVEGLPEDGTAGETPVGTPATVRVIIGTAWADVLSSSLDPHEPGVWRVRVRVPTQLACPAGACQAAVMLDFHGQRTNTNRQSQIISPTFNTIWLR